MTDSPHLLIIGVGGLGSAMVREALERSLRVSVLVRHPDKLLTSLGVATLDQLENVFVGDGTDPDVLDSAMASVDVVLSGRGADPHLAAAVATAVSRNAPRKLVWPAGSTNVKAEDGVTPNYVRLMPTATWAEAAYLSHQACIDAIRATDIISVIFCPGVMRAVGHRSPNINTRIRIDRDAGSFVSYEDAAWVMVEAATTSTYDGQLVTASTPT